jgi:DNA-binding CsgD family transcriptional regulator
MPNRTKSPPKSPSHPCVTALPQLPGVPEKRGPGRPPNPEKLARLARTCQPTRVEPHKLPTPCPVDPKLGCRVRTIENCALLNLSGARSLEEFWSATRNFFCDIQPLHGCDLGLAIEAGVPRTLCRSGGLGEPLDWTGGHGRLAICAPFIDNNPGIPAFRLADAISPGRLRKSDFFREIMQPEGWEHAAFLMVWNERKPGGFVAFYRDEAMGPFDLKEMIRLRTLQPAYAAMFLQFTRLRAEAIRAAGLERLLAGLSREQQTVVRCAAAGMTNKEIAVKLHRTEAAVKFQLHQVLQRFQLRNRAALAANFAPVRASGS